MSSVGPQSPGTVVDDNAVGTITWGTPSEAASSNDTYATASGTSSQSHYLKATNFDFSSIPSGSTINGITISIERKSSHNTGIRYTQDTVLSMVKTGTVTGDNKADTGTKWPTTDGSVNYGGTSVLWGTTWSDTDIKNSTTGVVLSVTVTGAAVTASVDHITMTVEYTAGAGGGSISVKAMHYSRMER